MLFIEFKKVETANRLFNRIDEIRQEQIAKGDGIRQLWLHTTEYDLLAYAYRKKKYYKTGQYFPTIFRKHTGIDIDFHGLCINMILGYVLYTTASGKLKTKYLGDY